MLARFFSRRNAEVERAERDVRALVYDCVSVTARRICADQEVSDKFVPAHARRFSRQAAATITKTIIDANRDKSPAEQAELIIAAAAASLSGIVAQINRELPAMIKARPFQTIGA
jgi:hypothetical protein